MKFVTKSALVVALLGWALLPPAVAQAQDGRLTLSFTPAVATTGGDSELALAGTAAYRFSEHFSFEGDVTWIDAAAGGFRNRGFDIDPRLAATNSITSLVQRVGNTFGGNNRLPITVPITLPALSGSTDGQTWIGTMGVRYEPRVQTSRFRPFVSGGLGINYTNEQFTLDSTSFTRAIDQSASHSGLAFSAGGGANIRLINSLWLAADAKYFHLSQDRDLMRLGGGVTFKF
jgi:opacity protein-like surface antigen